MYSLENLFWKTSQSSQVQTLQPTIEHFYIKFQIKEVRNSNKFQNVIIQQKPLPSIKKFLREKQSKYQRTMLFLAYILIAKQKFYRNSNDTDKHVITWQIVRRSWMANVSSNISFYFLVFSCRALRSLKQFSELSDNYWKSKIVLQSLKNFVEVS